MSLRVIIADSDPTTVELITVVLTRRGFAVQATLEGLDAVSRFADTSPDIVICDQVLSGVSAKLLCEQVKATRADAKVAILVPNGTDSGLSDELRANVGCDGVLERPFRFSEFSALMRAWALPLPDGEPDLDPQAFVVPLEEIALSLPQAVDAPTDMGRADASDAALDELPPMPSAMPLPIPIDNAEGVGDLQRNFHLSADGGATPAAVPTQAPPASAPASTKAPVSARAPVSGASPENVAVAEDLSGLLQAPGATGAAPKAPATGAARPARDPKKPSSGPARPATGAAKATLGADRPPTAERSLDEIGFDEVGSEANLPANIPVQGQLDAVPLPRLFYELYASTFSGVLQLVRGGVRRSVTFVAGLPVRVDSRQLNENLGHLLVEHGRISREQYDAAQKLIDEQGMRQGQALRAVGALDDETLAAALHEQTELKVANSFAWRDGEYLLVPDNGVAETEVLAEVNPLRAIWRGVRDHYENDGLEAFFSPLAGRYIVGAPSLAAQQASLGALLETAQMAPLFDGATTFATALSVEPALARERAVGLYVLLVTELVRAAEAPGDASSLPSAAAPSTGQTRPQRRGEAAEVVAPVADTPGLVAERTYREGLAKREAGDLAGARDCFLRAVELELGEAAYRVGLADVVWRLDPSGDASRRYALGVLEQALQLDPGSVDANLLAARILWAAGDAENARELAQRVLQRVPDHPEARAMVG